MGKENELVLQTMTHTAHEAAYKAGILHRDISIGNIMIFNSKKHNINGSMLIDWDLSKVHDLLVERSSACQYTRTVSKAHD
jgi:aminoglycoside phosphotransferase (APT) family kinase protein